MVSSLDCSQSALEYLTQKHKSLTSNEYKNEDDNYEECSRIALKLAKLFLAEGLTPTITEIKGRRVDSDNEPIIPKIFDGRIIWKHHAVCTINTTVYDPIVGHPMPLDDYCREIFTKEVQAKIVVRPEYVSAWIQCYQGV